MRTFIASAFFLAAECTVPAQNVVAWGDNTYGQTNVPASATNVIAVSAGDRHTLALRSDGSVIAWGSDSAGQTNVPDAATNVIAVAAGGNHSLALNADGTILGWGANGNGQISVPALATNPVALAAGENHSLALLADGTVAAWGDNQFGQINIPLTATNIIAIAAAGDHSVALRYDGQVLAWGRNNFRQTNVPYYVSGVVALSAGWTHDLALRADGKALGWGTKGKVGTNATDAVALAAGSGYSLVLHSNGRVTAWGTGSPLAITTNVPPAATNIVAVAAGLGHAVALIGAGSPLIRGPTQYNRRAPAGTPLPFYVQAAGAAPLHYQWLADGAPLTAPDSPLPAIPALLGNDHVAYQVVVSNDFGSVTSAPASVTVTPLCAWGDDLSRQFDAPPDATNLVALAGGAFHSLGLRQDGAVFGWGKNADGEATVPAAATNIVAVAGGSDHSLALRTDGTVIAWGRNWDTQTNVPVSATNVVAIAAGWAHSLALRADGTVLAWGNNDYGQCTVSFWAFGVTAIAAGYYQNLALKTDGTVVAWGLTNTVPAAATNVVAIAAGSGHSLALRADGTVIAWGDNSFGQINVPASATNVIAVAAGAFHSLALRADGKVLAWGSRYLSVTSVPTGLTNVALIASGETHNLVIVSDGSARFYPQVAALTCSAGGQALINPGLAGFSSAFSYQWFQDGVAVAGATNRNLFLNNLSAANAGNYTLVVTAPSGQATNQPVALVVQTNLVTFAALGAWGDDIQGQTDIPLGLSDVHTIAAGAFHALALSGDGTVTAWGKNADGQTNVPPLVTNITAIAAGSDHSLALSRDGVVIAWGRNLDGQTNVPPGATNIVAISAGWAHSVALRADGLVFAWGNNDVDQTNVPVTLSNVIRIAAGYYHTLALRSDHKVVSWGLYNSIPDGATNVVAIAAGWGHSLALRADGNVVAWGDNTYGQSIVPPAATNIIAVAAAWYYSLALRSDGAVLAWGKGSYGVTNVPSALDNIVSIAAGEDYWLALRQLGPPQIERSPESLVLHTGGHEIFTGDARGSQPLTFQWLHDGVVLAYATNRFLPIGPVSTSDAGAYTFIAANPITQTPSAPGSLTVLREPFVQTTPLFTNVLVGQPACLPAAITGEFPMSYQWLRNGSALADNGQISGSASPTLCIAAAQFADGGDYQVILQNSYGTYTGLVTHLSATPIIAWGDDFAGELDLPPDIGEVVGVAAGSDHSVALRADGSVIAWGDNTFGQCAVPAQATNIVSIAAYGAKSLALTADGTVLAWGNNPSNLTIVPASATNVVAITTSDTHSIALRADGSTVSWGTGPGVINGSSSHAPWVAVAAGRGYSMVLDAAGNIFEYGQSDNFGFPYISIAGGAYYRLAMMAGGGAKEYGSAPNGGGSGGFVILPSSVSNLAAIALSDQDSLFLGTNGTLFVKGDNTYGLTNVPVQASNLVAMTGGANHILSLLGSGRSALAGQASAKTVTLGDSVIFLSKTIGNVPATYQWQINGTNIFSASTPALVINPVRWTNAGVYRVIISDAFGSVVGPSFNLTILPPVLQFDTSSLSFQGTNNSFQMRLLGASGTGALVVYASTNLVDWVPTLTNAAVHGAVVLSVPTSSDQQQMFYRAAEVYNQ